MSNARDARGRRFSELVGVELRAAFARRGLSQTKVAKTLGHSQTAYSRWLNAKTPMPIETLLSTCELIGIEPQEIMDAAYRHLVEEMGTKGEGDQADNIDGKIVLTKEEILQLAAKRGDVEGEQQAYEDMP